MDNSKLYELLPTFDSIEIKNIFNGVMGDIRNILVVSSPNSNLDVHNTSFNKSVIREPFNSSIHSWLSFVTEGEDLGCIQSPKGILKPCTFCSGSRQQPFFEFSTIYAAYSSDLTCFDLCYTIHEHKRKKDQYYMRKMEELKSKIETFKSNINRSYNPISNLISEIVDLEQHISDLDRRLQDLESKRNSQVERATSRFLKDQMDRAKDKLDNEIAALEFEYERSDKKKSKKDFISNTSRYQTLKEMYDEFYESWKKAVGNENTEERIYLNSVSDIQRLKSLSLVTFGSIKESMREQIKDPLTYLINAVDYLNDFSTDASASGKIILNSADRDIKNIASFKAECINKIVLICKMNNISYLEAENIARKENSNREFNTQKTQAVIGSSKSGHHTKKKKATIVANLNGTVDETNIEYVSSINVSDKKPEEKREEKTEEKSEERDLDLPTDDEINMLETLRRLESGDVTSRQTIRNQNKLGTLDDIEDQFFQTIVKKKR